MISDLVVDTNVFVHAHNPNVGLRHQESRKLALRLLDADTTTALRVDPGFSPEPNSNRSRIGAEYLTHLVPGMLGHQVVQTLAASMRIRPVALAGDDQTRTEVEQLVTDPSDRVFLRVAIGSDAKVLALHDDAAFPDEVRSASHTRWAVLLGEAVDALALI